MPLKITLKAFERLFINGAIIRNGDRSVSFLMETTCQFLRESETVLESDADTPCKKLCVTLQAIHLAGNSGHPEHLFFSQAIEVMKVMPSAASSLSEIQLALSDKETYRALKICKQLIRDERELLALNDKAAKIA